MHPVQRGLLSFLERIAFTGFYEFDDIQLELCVASILESTLLKLAEGISGMEINDGSDV